MELSLTETEVRVLGSLIEKDITTPEYYPLSLNALVNACNQKSNRDPVMQLHEDAIRDALGGLQERRLAGPAGGADSRVPKYEHRLQEVFNFTRPEIAVLCVLLLRGPQTPGELRGRSERIHRFEALDDVQSALQKLMQRDPALVKVLPRQPGTKEARWAHLFSGDVAREAAQMARTAGDRSFRRWRAHCSTGGRSVRTAPGSRRHQGSTGAVSEAVRVIVSGGHSCPSLLILPLHLGLTPADRDTRGQGQHQNQRQRRRTRVSDPHSPTAPAPAHTQPRPAPR